MANPLHTYKTFISFGDTDASKRIYYANIFAIVHRAAEDFAITSGVYKEWFENAEWSTPVRHTEAEYLAELRAGDALDIKLYIDKIGETSFTWRFEVFKNSKVAAIVRVTHVAIDKKTGQKRQVPEKLRELATQN